MRPDVLLEVVGGSILSLCPSPPATNSKAPSPPSPLGDIMAHVVVQVGDNEIESIITRRSVEEMAFKIGDRVAVVIKSTEVMIQK